MLTTFHICQTHAKTYIILSIILREILLLWPFCRWETWNKFIHLTHASSLYTELMLQLNTKWCVITFTHLIPPWECSEGKNGVLFTFVFPDPSNQKVLNKWWINRSKTLIWKTIMPTSDIILIFRIANMHTNYSKKSSKII